ncbi:MAG: hypothetical protein QOJ89_2936 [bacterium]|jgi:hypothetical protein
MPTEPGEIALVLRVDLDADPIRGSLTCADGTSRRFSGWIAMAAALETIRVESARPPGPGVQARS